MKENRNGGKWPGFPSTLLQSHLLPGGTSLLPNISFLPQEEVSKPQLSLSSQPRHLLYWPVINYCSQKEGDRRVRLLSETLFWLKVFLDLDLESEPPCLHLIFHTLMGWTAEWFLKAKKHPLTLRQWWIQMLNSKIVKQAIYMTILLVLAENHTTGSVLLLEHSLCKRGACLGLVHKIFYHCLKKGIPI